MRTNTSRILQLFIASLFIAAGPEPAEAIIPSSLDAAVIVLPWDADKVARPAAQHLRAQLDVGSRVVTTTLAADIPALLKIARATWPERWAIVIDPARARVTVVRPADGTILSRSIDPTVATEAPYAVALTALELFGLARDTKGAAIINESAETRFGRANTIRTSIAVDASLAITASPDHEVTLAQPMIGAALILRGSDTLWWASFGLRTRVLGARDTTLPGSAGELGLHYERIDAALRLMLGRREGRFDLALAIDAGGSRVSVTAKSQDGSTIAQDDRWTPWAGSGVEARLRIIGGFSFSIGGGLIFVPRPTRYHVRDDFYSEGSVRIVGSVGLVAELG